METRPGFGEVVLPHRNVIYFFSPVFLKLESFPPHVNLQHFRKYSSPTTPFRDAKLSPKGDCVQFWLKDPWQGWHENISQIEVGEGQDWSNQEHFQEGLGEGQPWVAWKREASSAWWIQEGFREESLQSEI